MSIEVNRADFPGPNGERNYKIVVEYLSYVRPLKCGKGYKSEFVEGSYSWLGRKYGVTQRTVIGIVWRWRNIVEARQSNADKYRVDMAREPYRPRTNY